MLGKLLSAGPLPLVLSRRKSENTEVIFPSYPRSSHSDATHRAPHRICVAAHVPSRTRRGSETAPFSATLAPSDFRAERLGRPDIRIHNSPGRSAASAAGAIRLTSISYSKCSTFPPLPAEPTPDKPVILPICTGCEFRTPHDGTRARRTRLYRLHGPRDLQIDFLLLVASPFATRRWMFAGVSVTS